MDAPAGGDGMFVPCVVENLAQKVFRQGGRFSCESIQGDVLHPADLRVLEGPDFSGVVLNDCPLQVIVRAVVCDEYGQT